MSLTLQKNVSNPNVGVFLSALDFYFQIAVSREKSCTLIKPQGRKNIKENTTQASSKYVLALLLSGLIFQHSVELLLIPLCCSFLHVR